MSSNTSHRLCVAPMMDWTDRHCRYYLRQVNSTARLYTEMITTGALIHGDVDRHLAFSEEEHPVAVQLGGCDPGELAACAKMAQAYGYDEVNLNIGCPSERVQKGAFGACLMAEPALVAECVRAIRAAVEIPVTVKHRVGIDDVEDYAFVQAFVATVSDAGCGVFIVHARNAVLKGLSPKENREIPPLKYDYVYRLKRDFPQLQFVINGGITTQAQIEAQLGRVDGVMLGRAAYHDSWLLADPGRTRAEVVHRMVDYCRRMAASRFNLRNVTRHMLGLYHGHRRARLWP
jgi:tRNA-dihydrouridine synthase A